jgi:plasmid stabilization system protein ParE
MTRVRLAPEAVEDLESIFRYICLHDPRAANAIRQRLFDRITQLGQFPNMGPASREIEGLRELTEGSYVICYDVTIESVNVLRVFHGAQDRARRFKPLK